MKQRKRIPTPNTTKFTFEKTENGNKELLVSNANLKGSVTLISYGEVLGHTLIGRVKIFKGSDGDSDHRSNGEVPQMHTLVGKES